MSSSAQQYPLQTFGDAKNALIAKEMASGRGMEIFKNFKELNIQNILYLQWELLELENDVNRPVPAHVPQGTAPLNAAVTPTAPIASTSSIGPITPTAPIISPTPAVLTTPITYDPQGGQSSSLDSITAKETKMKEIRIKLKEYNEALLQYAELESLRPPRKHLLRTLQYWMWDINAGNGLLSDVQIAPYRGEGEGLVAPSEHGRGELDMFSDFVIETLMPKIVEIFSCIIKRMPFEFTTSGNLKVNDAYFDFLARIITIIFATLYPAIAVVVLYFLPSLISRLGSILAFSFLFATTLAIFTTADAANIFAFTAASASVQVVFVGSTSLLDQKNGTNSG